MTGIPIVGSLVGGTGEVLGRRRRLARDRPDDPEAYVAAIRDVLADPAEARRRSRGAPRAADARAAPRRPSPSSVARPAARSAPGTRGRRNDHRPHAHRDRTRRDRRLRPDHAVRRPRGRGARERAGSGPDHHRARRGDGDDPGLLPPAALRPLGAPRPRRGRPRPGAQRARPGDCEGRFLAFLDADDLFSQQLAGGRDRRRSTRRPSRASARSPTPSSTWSSTGSSDVLLNVDQGSPLFSPHYLYFRHYYDSLCLAPREAHLDDPVRDPGRAPRTVLPGLPVHHRDARAGWRHIVVRDTIIFKRRRDFSLVTESNGRQVGRAGAAGHGDRPDPRPRQPRGSDVRRVSRRGLALGQPRAAGCAVCSGSSDSVEEVVEPSRVELLLGGGVVGLPRRLEQLAALSPSTSGHRRLGSSHWAMNSSRKVSGSVRVGPLEASRQPSTSCRLSIMPAVAPSFSTR